MTARLRVAVTVEQCWHRVPGGTATSILGLLGALVAQHDLELVGVAARHSSAPPAGFDPPIPVRHLPLPRPALYEAWHGLRRPSVQRATGPVDLVHATAVAVPPKRGPLVVTIHDLAFLDDPTLVTRHGNRFFRRGTALARRDADLVMVPSRATAAACERAGFDPDRIRVVAWGVDVRPAPPEAVEEVRRRFGLARPFVLFVGTLEPRKNLAGVLAAFTTLPDDVDLVVAGPDGWNEDFAGRLGGRGAAGCRPGAPARLPADGRPPRAVRRLRGRLLPEHQGGVRPARARCHGPRGTGGHLGGDRHRGGRRRRRTRRGSG